MPQDVSQLLSGVGRAPGQIVANALSFLLKADIVRYQIKRLLPYSMDDVLRRVVVGRVRGYR
jgi:hypothetical protein